MKQLGRAQPLDDFETEALGPTVEEIGRQRLRRRQAQRQAAEVGRGRARVVDQGVVQRRQPEQEGRPIALDAIEDRIGRGPPRTQHRGRADRERKRERVAEAVGEENLGRRIANI